MCRRTSTLEVHHINRASGNSLSNARVLCHHCHTQTSSYGKPGTSPPSFSDAVKAQAMQRANYKCECKGCKQCL